MKTTLLLICLFFAASGQAQEYEKPRKWKVELTGALNNYSAWEVEPSITYQPIPYAGITMGLLFSKIISEDNYIGTSLDKRWEWTSTEDNQICQLLTFRPALQFATPALKLGKDKDMGLSFIVSPGLTIPFFPNQTLDIQYVPNNPGVWVPERFDRIKNKGGRSVFYHIKGMLTLDLDEQYTLSAGYTFSDFDLYSGGRNIIVEGKRLTFPHYRFMHSVFLSIGYRF